MKATDFDYRHQTLVHQFIVAAAFLTYFVDREDISKRENCRLLGKPKIPGDGVQAQDFFEPR
jgi:hypothetical protein